MAFDSLHGGEDTQTHTGQFQETRHVLGLKMHNWTKYLDITTGESLLTGP